MNKNLIVLMTLAAASLLPSLALGEDVSHQVIINSLSTGIENSRKLMIGLAVLTVFTTCGMLAFMILRMQRRNMTMMNALLDRLDRLEDIGGTVARRAPAEVIATPKAQAVPPESEFAPAPELEKPRSPPMADAVQSAGPVAIQNGEIRVILENLDKKHAPLVAAVELHAMDGLQIAEAVKGDDSFADSPDPIQLNHELSDLLLSMKDRIELFTPVLAKIENSGSGQSSGPISRRLPWPFSILQKDDHRRALKILREVGENQALLEKFFYFYQRKRGKYAVLGDDKARAKKILLLNHELVALTKSIKHRLDATAEAIARLKRGQPA